MATTTPPPESVPKPVPTPSNPPGKIRFRSLVRASGGPRYVVAVTVDSIGGGLVRPFLLLYGIDVLRLAAPVAGLSMTAGVVVGLAATPLMGRWLDRGARSAAVSASMGIRVLGIGLLVADPAGSPATVWLFTVAALFLSIGNQSFYVANSALVTMFSTGRERDAALAAGRSVRNAGLAAGALLATIALADGVSALHALAIVTGAAYLVAAVLVWSVRVHADPRAQRPDAEPGAAAPRMWLLLIANVVFVLSYGIPEFELPLVLVTQLHASPLWASAVFVTNAVLVVVFQVPMTVWMARFQRRTALAIAGVVITVSYLGFLGAVALPRAWAPAAILALSVLATVGEIIIAGTSTALVAATAPAHALGRALARIELSTGFSLAVTPTIVTVLAAHGPVALWGTLAAVTLLASGAIAR